MTGDNETSLTKSVLEALDESIGKLTFLQNFEGELICLVDNSMQKDSD